MHRILVIDDAEEIPLMVESAFNPESYLIESAGTVRDALRLVKENTYSLVIIDIGLPDGNGLDLFLKIKSLPSYAKVPTVFLTSNEEVSSIVSAFSLGADDYIVKPFHLLELRARIERRLGAAAPLKSDPAQIVAGELVLTPASQRVKIRGKNESIDLTAREFKILLLLVNSPDDVFSRKAILENIWGEKVNVTERTVDAHICYLRKKLDHYSNYIESVPGAGYRFNPHIKNNLFSS